MDTKDLNLLQDTLKEIDARAIHIFHRMGLKLNRYNNVTARADCLRIARAAIELSPTLPPQDSIYYNDDED